MGSTIVGLMIVAFVLFVFVMIVIAIRRDSVCYNDCCDDVVEDEVITTTTTTTTEVCGGGHEVNGYHVEGFLAVVVENGQGFVIDPADGVKTPVNDGDDLYQDAANKIWELR